MGRMIDILRNAERRPETQSVKALDHESATIGTELAQGVDETASLKTDLPIFDEDDPTVPFIEVGAGREPTQRLLPPLPTKPRIVEPAAPIAVAPSPPAALGLISIRFQPVHPARMGKRNIATEIVAFHQPDHPVSVQYRSLSVEISRQLPGSLPRVLLICGMSDGVGTSTVALNLAVTIARQDLRVTIVDANLTRPALADRLGLPSGPGLKEVLAGQMPPAWCLQESIQSNLVVLPAGASGVPRSGAELVPIIEMLRDRSDCVLLDGGPWNDAAVANELASACDAVYLVMRQELAATPAAIEMQELIVQKTGRLRGCVLTER